MDPQSESPFQPRSRRRTAQRFGGFLGGKGMFLKFLANVQCRMNRHERARGLGPGFVVVFSFEGLFHESTREASNLGRSNLKYEEPPLLHPLRKDAVECQEKLRSSGMAAAQHFVLEPWRLTGPPKWGCHCWSWYLLFGWFLIWKPRGQGENREAKSILGELETERVNQDTVVMTYHSGAYASCGSACAPQFAQKRMPALSPALASWQLLFER